MTDVPGSPAVRARSPKPRARLGLPPLAGLLAGAAVSLALWALLLRLLSALF